MVLDVEKIYVKVASTPSFAAANNTNANVNNPNLYSIKCIKSILVIAM